MNKLDIDYQNLVKDILENGVVKTTRNGKVLSVFGRSIRYKFKDGKFPLLTTKKMAWKQIVTELLWFLKGDTNIKYLLENDCHIWDGDAYQLYKLKHNFQINQGIDILSQDEFINRIKTDDNFAKEFGELGPIYGKQWRRWKKVDEVWDERLIPPFKIENIELIDQIVNLINDLKTNPDSRRLMVNAWNVSELDKVVLPPCFTENMLVKCKYGYKKISNISTDDYVLTEDGTYQKVYAIQTTSYDDRLIGIRVYGNNTIITSTPDHPFLIKDKGYVKASKVTEDDYLGIPLNKNEIVPTFSSEIGDIINKEDFWFLLGYFMGDGWINHETKELFLTIDEKDHHMVFNRLKNIIPLDDVSEENDLIKKYVSKNTDFNDILTMFGDVGENRVIPEFIYDSPKHFINEFIEGFNLSDGGENDGERKFYTLSSSVAYGLQLLYSKLNIRVSVSYNKESEMFTINSSKQKNKSSKFIFDENYLWLKVKTIKELDGKETNGFVYNLSVENNHTYNVFNLVNHNCHYGFQLYTEELNLNDRFNLWEKLENKNIDDFPIGPLSDEQYHGILNELDVPRRKISLMWNQRSIDVPLGLPFNIASYGLLLELIAKEVNMVPDELIGNLGDCHIYINQIDGIKRQLTREPFPLPMVTLSDRIVNDISEYTLDDIKLENYQFHSTIKIPLSN